MMNATAATEAALLNREVLDTLLGGIKIELEFHEYLTHTYGSLLDEHVETLVWTEAWHTEAARLIFSDIEYDIINFDAVEDLYKTLRNPMSQSLVTGCKQGNNDDKDVEEMDIHLNDVDVDIDW